MLGKVEISNNDTTVLFSLQEEDLTELLEDEPFFIDLKEYGMPDRYTYIFYAKSDYLAELAVKKFLEPRFKTFQGKIAYIWLNSDTFHKLKTGGYFHRTHIDYGFSIILCHQKEIEKARESLPTRSKYRLPRAIY
jgi:hypothetical protein